MENTCDCDVEYKLWYSAELTPDGTKGVSKDKVFYEYSALNSLSSTKESKNYQEILFCENAEGIYIVQSFTLKYLLSFVQAYFVADPGHG